MKPPNLRILVVEDHREFRRLLRSLFESAGFVVDTAADGPAALELFHACSPSLAVLDLGLPYMDGREVCRHLKSAEPSLPIIMISAGTDPKRELLALGADDYLSKPFSLPELLARTWALLRRPGQDRQL